MPYKKYTGYKPVTGQSKKFSLARNRIMSPKQKVIALAGRLFKVGRMK